MSDDHNTRREQRRAMMRTAEERDGSEPIGVMAHPGPAERREEHTRDEYRPEVSADDVTKFSRRRRDQRTVGGFDLPKHRQKPGWSYQWMTIRVLNEPVDASQIRSFTHDGGWRPVPTRDMPELNDENASPDAPIEMMGQRLYMRPMSLTLEARQEDMEYAMEQQRDRTMAAASGQSAIRGKEGFGDHRGVKRVPLGIEIESLSG